MIGHTLGSYRIERELGRGGMGSVWVGVHALLGRRAAIKVLLPELSRKQDIVQRFFNEARAATAIKHAGIVEIYDFGWAPEGAAYLVMELLEGAPLSARMRAAGQLPVPFALGVARQVALALGAAHKAGVIHRDLKPDNVFLVPDEEVALGQRIKLLDFGIAKLADDAPGTLARTHTGAVMGTPFYMSPEQCRGAGQVDARSDLYALGCILYEMIGGRVPFTGEGAGEIIGAHLHVEVPPLRGLAPDVPGAVEALVLRLLAKRPDDRPPTGEAVARELADLAAGLGATLPGTAAGAPSAPVSAQRPAIAREPGQATTLGGASGESATMLAARAGTGSDDDDDGALAAAPPRRRLGAYLGAGVVAAAGLGVAILLATRGPGDRAREATAPPARSVDAAVVARAPDAGVVSGDAGPSPEELAERTIESAQRLVEADRAADALDWPTALRAGREALALAPESVEAQELVARAERELGLSPATGADAGVAAPPKPSSKPKPKPKPKPDPAPGTGTGYLSLDTTPAADVFLGEMRLGRTPLAKLALPTGTHTLTLRGPKGTQTLKVKIDAGKTVTRTVTLGK